MTVEGFRRYLKPLIDKKRPFIAYWHPHGTGWMSTGTISQTRTVYTVHYADGRKPRIFRNPSKADAAIESARSKGIKVEVTRSEEPAPPKRVPQSAINAFRREIRKMERNPRTQPLITVEFDGEHINTTGGFTYE